jgi:hypothetical protein
VATLPKQLRVLTNIAPKQGLASWLMIHTLFNRQHTASLSHTTLTNPSPQSRVCLCPHVCVHKLVQFVHTCCTQASRLRSKQVTVYLYKATLAHLHSCPLKLLPTYEDKPPVLSSSTAAALCISLSLQQRSLLDLAVFRKNRP